MSRVPLTHFVPIMTLLAAHNNADEAPTRSVALHGRRDPVAPTQKRPKNSKKSNPTGIQQRKIGTSQVLTSKATKIEPQCPARQLKKKNAKSTAHAYRSFWIASKGC